MGFLQPKYSKQAAKYLEKLDQKTALRLITAINKLPNGDVRKMRGFKNLYRLRVGDFRIKFTHDNGQITVEELGARGDIYKKGTFIL